MGLGSVFIVGGYCHEGTKTRSFYFVTWRLSGSK